jgi:hypothetical protein
MIEYIQANYVQYFFMGATAIFSYVLKQALKRGREETLKIGAISVGMQSLLRDRIVQAHHTHVSQHYCSVHDKEVIRRMYEAYHALEGNDIATRLVEEILNLPSVEAESEGTLCHR